MIDGVGVECGRAHTMDTKHWGLSQSGWAAMTKYHRLHGLNNRSLFLTVLEAEVQDEGLPRFGVW